MSEIDVLSETIGYLKTQMITHNSEISRIIQKLDVIDDRLKSVEEYIKSDTLIRNKNSITNRNIILFISPIVGAISGAIAGFLVSFLR
jgi:tetrahydromethanopterin S-methyltransferase subunit F